MKPPPLKPGDELTSSWLNDALDSAPTVRADPASGLESVDFGRGPVLRARNRLEIWAKVGAHGSGGKYAWTQQLDTPSGGWANGPRSGTTTDNPLVEANGNTGVALNKVVRAWKDSNGFCWKFIYGSC